MRCAVCDTWFVARSDARYCSGACRQKAYRQRQGDPLPPAVSVTDTEAGDRQARHCDGDAVSVTDRLGGKLVMVVEFTARRGFRGVSKYRLMG